MSKRTFIALMIVFTGACAFLFNVFYKEAKNTAITKLNEEQMIHAKQAARGIEEFFATWTRSLNSLSKMDEIIDTGAVGTHYMKLFYEANQEQVRSITRLDERGVIIHNFPQSNSVGADISDQKHVRELLRDHKPVISDVFKAVEGFDAVALHVPVFKGPVFKGSIGILINFESIANRYLDVIKIGETGYAWVVSRDGTLLYSPASGLTGKSIFETIKKSPSLTVMANDMLKGNEGAAIYSVGGTGDRNAGRIREYAVYMPVRIDNTYWSIAVASAEQDVLSGLISFRDKLAFAVGAIFICGMVFSILAAKAWFIVKEEEKRKQAEKKLQESEQIAEKFSTLFHAAPFAMALATAPDGVLYDVNPAWLDLAGFTRKEEVIGKSSVELGAIREAEPRERILNEFRQHGSVRNAEVATSTRTGAQLALLVNLDWVDIGGSKLILSSMQDITGRKEAEEALSRSREWFRTTLGSIGDAVIATDVSGRVTFLNPIGVELTGWKLEEALGQPIRSVFRIINEQTRRPAENIVERVLREGCIVSLANHTALITPDGREIPIEDSAAPIKDSAGNIIGVVLAFHDVTEKRRTQEVLKQSEEHYRSLFDNMMNGYAYCRMLFEEDEPEDFIYLNVNRAFETLTGLENVIGKKVSEVIPGIRESDSELFEIYGRVAKTGVPERFETYVEALGMWFSISVYSPRREHFVAVFDVITERKKADEALRQKEAALNEAQRIAHIGSWYWDAETDVTTGTEELLRIYGFDPAAQIMPDFR
ncbi:MAG: PAS domain S-box protein, partial [Syntrophobacteraceae bacterium]